MLKQILKEKHKGFAGMTHFLIAILLFFLMWLIPWDFCQNYINSIKSNVLFGIIIFLTIGGASLLPDLDCSPIEDGGSIAVYQLGILGQLLSVLCVTLSGIVFSLVHTKNDEKPKSQHRMLFHTGLIPVLIYIGTIIYIPESLETLSGNFNKENTSIFILIIFASISVYLGASILFYKVLKIFGKQRYSQFLCLLVMVLSIVYMYFLPFYKLRLIGIAIALGYLFHILGDMITKGSSPLFFPIPLPKKGHLQLWRKPYILGSFSITTGGIFNTILNFILIAIDCFLFYFLFL